MTLIATGDNLRNKSLMGLQAMSREEAEREALYQQMVQQKAAQRSQLAGTGLGIGASYAVNNSDKVAALGSKIFGGGQAAGLNIAAPSAAGLQQSVAGASKLGGEVAALTKTPLAGTLDAGVANALTTQGGQSAFLQTGAGLSATAPAAQVASGAAATGEALAASSAAANSAVATGTAAGSAGTLATLGTIAAPLAIGVGAFYLLNKLFD